MIVFAIRRNARSEVERWLRNGIERRNLGLIELQIEASQVHVELVGRPCADDGRHAGFRLNPGDQDGRGRHTQLLDDLLELVRYGERRLGQILGHSRASSWVGQAGVLPCAFARQGPAAKRRPGEEFAIDRTFDQRVFDPATGEPHPQSSPNVIVPRQTGLTRRPERPRVTERPSGMTFLC